MPGQTKVSGDEHADEQAAKDVASKPGEADVSAICARNTKGGKERPRQAAQERAGNDHIGEYFQSSDNHIGELYFQSSNNDVD